MVGYATVKFTPDKAGTYVVVLNAIGATTGAITQAITVTAKTVGKSTAFIGTSVGANDTATADATVSTTAASSTTAKARIDVGSIYGTTGNDTASATDAPSVVVTTTKGLVSKTNDFFAGAKTVTTAAGVDADPSYWVFSNGDVGAASITITVGGVLLATKTVTFTGVATALVATLTTGQAKYVGVDATTTLAITSTDAAASTVSNPSGLTVKSSDTSVATAVQTTNILTTITGVNCQLLLCFARHIAEVDVVVIKEHTLRQVCTGSVLTPPERHYVFKARERHHVVGVNPYDLAQLNTNSLMT
jgi:hypothetical protein